MLSQPYIKLMTTSTYITLEDQKLLDLETSTSLETYGMDHYTWRITATISAPQLSSLSDGREGFFRVCVLKKIGRKSQLHPHCSRGGELFHSCCIWWCVKASLRAKDVACHHNTVLAAHPLCYTRFCSSWALPFQDEQPLGWCWLGL